MVILRDATVADIDAILAIHNDAIATSKAIWTDEPASRSDREAWLAQRHADGYPVVVAMTGDVLAGFGSYGSWRARRGYRFTVEDSIYLAEDHRGKGIGGLLLAELLTRARTAGMHVMIADIEASNAASIALHRKFGFGSVGTVHQVGTKFGLWLDLVILQLDLTAQ